MKRMIALLLALATLLSLTACGGSAPAETKPAETAPAAAPTEEPTEAPTTEPTLSPEEVLYNSLSERMKQSVDVGIVELSQVENPDKEITIAEAAKMLQNAYTLYNGTESKLMADVLALDCASEPAYLGWIGRLPIAMYVEDMEPEKFENYDQWIDYVIKLSQGYDLSSMVTAPIGAEGYSYWEGDDTFYAHSYAWYEIGWKNGMDKYFFRNMEAGNALLDGCVGQGNLLAYTAYMTDRTTGHKVLEVSLYDEVEVEHIMTVSDMAEMALRTYYAFYTEPEVAPYEECTTADSAILTEELLNRETTLPDASCNDLPAEWHGVTMDAVSLIYSYGVATSSGRYDTEIREYEIQAIKDTGFNYIGLQIDFDWLQGCDWTSRTDALDGQLDVGRLKQLDQILAWCMERDIHLDIRATGAGGMIPDKQDNWTVSEKTAQEYAKIWSVLARRYAEVPNTYLSFTVMDLNLFADWDFAAKLGVNQDTIVGFLKPAVDSIRETTPGRCIIVDLSGSSVGTDILELGVALSVDLSSTESDFFSVQKMDKKLMDPDYYLSAQWPYKGKTDAESLLHVDQSWKKGSTAQRVMELAQENGLGFMFSGWGRIAVDYMGIHCSTRYPDETYQAFVTDMTDTMESYGYGWCYEEWYGHNGITFSAPIMKNVTYEQIGDYPMYYDTFMRDLFKSINGVN